MWRYFWRLGLKSLRRTPGLTALMVLTIGVGIGTSMTSFAVFRAVSGDPIPDKSAQLYVPQVDAWGPKHRDPALGPDEPVAALTYTDAMALMQAHRARYQSIQYPVHFSLIPDDPALSPMSVIGHASFGELFPMVEAPFRYGGPWSADDDARGAPMVVLGAELNRQLFGDRNSVGQEVNLDGHRLRVVGVLKPWNPQPVFYDVVSHDAFAQGDQFFVPFNWAVNQQIQTAGNNNCVTDSAPGYDGWLHSSCLWISMLVELPGASEAAGYRQFLQAYQREQQASGRFDWAPQTRLRDLRQWLEFRHVVPDETRVSMLISFGFLLVCLCNVVGLMLARFMRRAPEIGVRRALGASRLRIAQQFLIEAGVLGLSGGVVGLGVTTVGMLSLPWVFPPQVAALARLDAALVLMTVVLAVLVAVVAGLFPTLRAAQVRPAWQLKID